MKTNFQKVILKIRRFTPKRITSSGIHLRDTHSSKIT